MTKKELALEYHKRGYNCAQAVACAFCEEFGISEAEMYKIAEGFGLGMGMMDTCGALTGLFMHLWSADRTVYADRIKEQRRNRAGRKDEGKHLQKDERVCCKVSGNQRICLL